MSEVTQAEGLANPDVVAARCIVDAAGGRALNTAEAWAVGDVLIKILDGYDPADKGDAKKERELLLSGLSPQLGLTTARCRDYWRFAALFPPGIRRPGKSWNEHRMAALRSGEGRNRHDIPLALRLLDGEEGALEHADPFASADLTANQLERARRIWKNRDDLADPKVVKTVTSVLRGQRRKGAEAVANAVHARALQKLREIEALEKLQSGEHAYDIVNRYHKEMLKATDASYQLKLLCENLDPGPARRAVRMMIEGSVIAASRAIEDLLDVLEGGTDEDGDST